MNIIVLLKQVPDLVEELEIDESGKALDRSWLRFILNEFDDHALEQGLLLKERHGGQVRVLALDRKEINEALFIALAKGADRAAKATGDFNREPDSHTAARIFRSMVSHLNFDLILTGVQANDDLDGQVGAILAAYLDLPYVGVVSRVRIGEDGTATVSKEYPRGVLAEISVKLPAILGIQAADQPPRYVPVARIRQATKTASIEEIAVPQVKTDPSSPDLRIRHMFKPEVSGHAEILSGNTEEVVVRLMDILSEKGLVR